MIYKYEYCGNKDYVCLHVKKRILSVNYASRTIGATEGDKEFLEFMEGTDGVEEISGTAYSISAKRGLAFSREETLGFLKERLKLWFEMNGLVDDVWTQLPTYREDIAVHQCLTCQQEQDRMVAEIGDDLHSLDY